MYSYSYGYRRKHHLSGSLCFTGINTRYPVGFRGVVQCIVATYSSTVATSVSAIPPAFPPTKQIVAR